MSRSDLTLRILHAVPSAAYEMQGLLSLLAVEESEAVPTAAVSCERRPVLRVNPRFVAERCQAPEHLLLLVLHELHHVLLGHTRLFPRATRAQNVAFDAVVNALLCARFPDQAYTSFFLGLYGREHGPLRLLAPPLAVRAPAPLDALHSRLYASDGGATAREVYEAIVREVDALPDGEGGDPEDAPPLLGGHGDEGEEDWGTAGPLARDVVDAVREIVERWPAPACPERGRSLTDLLRETRVRSLRPPETVLSAVRRALDAASNPRRRGTLRGGAVPALLPLPSLRDRRASVLRQSGSEPLFFAGETRSAAGRRAGSTSVYLDVSGSMEGYLPALYGAFRALRSRIDPDVRVFSTRVFRVPLEQLVAGKCKSTGGTDGRAALLDALASRARRVLLVTDGYVGRPDPELAARVRRAGLEVRVLLTPGGWRDDLAALASRVDVLPALTEGGAA
ncbi:VWA domain-containing protein [Acidobacteria bacterium ACD]|nr:VWA domain-containing protein [Acidobacteria bacterium ACD]